MMTAINCATWLPPFCLTVYSTSLDPPSWRPTSENEYLHHNVSSASPTASREKEWRDTTCEAKIAHTLQRLYQLHQLQVGYHVDYRPNKPLRLSSLGRLHYIDYKYWRPPARDYIVCMYAICRYTAKITSSTCRLHYCEGE